MKSIEINVSPRRFFVYSFPEVNDDSGNRDLTLLTDSDYYLTSISTAVGNNFFIYNLSLEKQIIPTLLPTVLPIITGNGGTPYFLPVPWKLTGGTILRLMDGLNSQVSLAGYRQ